MSMSLEQKAKLLIAEALSKKKYVAATFLATLAVAMAVGLLWPARYVSSATIVVDNRAIMMPLARGESRHSGVMDQAKVAQHLVRSRRIVRRAMVFAGWLNGHPSPKMQQRLIAKVRKRITVTDAGKNLIRISYRDSSRRRAHRMTERLVQLFLAETANMRAREDQAAYQFVTAEVHRYREKLAAEGRELAKVRAGVMGSGIVQAHGRRLLHLQAQRDTASVELQEARSERAALEHQLQGQALEDAQAARIDGLRKQLDAYRSELGKLELSYQSHYPGIVILKSRIASVRKRIHAAEQTASDKPHGAPIFASETSADRFYQGIQKALASTNTKIAVLKARIQVSDRLINGNRRAASAVYHGRTVSQLMRNYAIDTKTLSGLLKRRENARLAMSMGKAQNDVSFHVADQASLPMYPAGPSFGMFALAGLLAGLVLPFALLHIRAQVDQRVRFSSVISEKLNLPIVATIPHLATPSETVQSKRGMQWLGVLAASMVFIVAGILFSGSMI